MTKRCGSLGYMAPEVVKGSPAALLHRTPICGGVNLHELPHASREVFVAMGALYSRFYVLNLRCAFPTCVATQPGSYSELCDLWSVGVAWTKERCR